MHELSIPPDLVQRVIARAGRAHPFDVMEPKKTYLYANQGVVFMAALVFFEYRGWIPPVKTLMFDIPGWYRFAIMAIVFQIYNVLAYFVRYMAGILRKREKYLY